MTRKFILIGITVLVFGGWCVKGLVELMVAFQAMTIGSM